MVLATTTLLGWMAFGTSLKLPNGYDLNYDRTPPRFASPVDRNNRISLDLASGRVLGGATLSLRYDEEDRAMGDDADSVMIRLKWKF
jgi:hypothetical protein